MLYHNSTYGLERQFQGHCMDIFLVDSALVNKLMLTVMLTRLVQSETTPDSCTDSDGESCLCNY